MKYEFSRRKKESGKIIFALTLDRKKMTERIVIGEMNETRRHLNGGNGDIIFDSSRNLGDLLIHFESDPDQLWSANAARLCESYNYTFPFESKRWETAAPAVDFLRSKYNSGEPSAMFAAVRTWEEYLPCYNLNKGADVLVNRLNMMYRPFLQYGSHMKPWQEGAASVLSQTLCDDESSLELWYPVSKRPFECVAAYSSFQPIITYYLYKLAEWKYVLKECKVCGKQFLAKSRRFGLCSDECRKVQARQAKRKHDGQIEGDFIESVHEASYYYWYNRLRKLKRAKVPDNTKIAEVSSAFESFRKEAVKRKNMVKSGKLPTSDFSRWLVEQEAVINNLID